MATFELVGGVGCYCKILIQCITTLDNLLESILIFQKGRFNYKSKTKEQREDSKIDKEEFQKNDWYMTLWENDKCLAWFKTGEKTSLRFLKNSPIGLFDCFPIRERLY